MRVDRALLRRFLTGMRSDPNAADRLVLVLLSLVGLRFANWLWLSARIPGRAAFVANVALQVLSFAVFVFLIAQSCRTTLPHWLRVHRPGRLLIVSPMVVVALFLLVSSSIVHSLASGDLLIDDANAMAVCGAQSIAAGHDPYRVSEINCLKHLGLSPALSTPLRVGPLAKVPIYPTPTQIRAAIATAGARGGTSSVFSGLAKPPLDPVTMVPVASASPVVRALWTLGAMLVLAIAVGVAAGSLWPAALTVVLGTYFIPGSALNFASFGNAESVAYVLMALSVLWIRRPLISGICLGLAMGSNELAIFLFPAYLLMSLEAPGQARRLLGLGLALLLGVGPWLVRYPDAIPTVWRYLTAPTFPLGYGPVELVLGGVVKAPPAVVFFAATALALLLILLWGWRWSLWRISASVLFFAAFWLSWRSLDEYMAQIPLLALAAILALLHPTVSPDSSPPIQARNRTAHRR